MGKLIKILSAQSVEMIGQDQSGGGEKKAMMVQHHLDMHVHMINDSCWNGGQMSITSGKIKHSSSSVDQAFIRFLFQKIFLQKNIKHSFQNLTSIVLANVGRAW